ncbi:pitrilysin family protein [Notoacmeibacter sp. MSK16QG-6]|uniref:M16 family metallopeptidase n=1 Tax=Notoacmeibacter sp. MSK16QG-6 TaxID=2957982 RepID=UPI00209EA067|nr:pitrilysin family protein [Notoacmeibacter sp. MSK16QG-6]MCP1198503.1 insulinase family protein [Notoacmeibacter sp. MSK16QG-6]
MKKTMIAMLNISIQKTAVVAVAAAALLLGSPASAAVKIQEVVSPGGIKAWLVEDYTVPLVSMKFAFKGGSSQDPDGKGGLAKLMTGLFDEGAGDLDRAAFQDALDVSGAEMGFTAGIDEITGSMTWLAEREDEAVRLLTLAVNDPRFDDEPVKRMKSQFLTSLIAEERDPNTIAGRKWRKEIYGDHAYARDSDGTKETMAGLTADDLRAFHKSQFARDNLMVAAVGAISAEKLGERLDQIFGDLPAKAKLQDVPDLEPKFGHVVHYEYPLPQTRLSLLYPGVEREDPRFFAAYLANHILGGGTFSSRLYDEVREKRGLAYGVGSNLSNFDHTSTWGIGTATSADRAAETLDIIRGEVKKVAETGVTQQELDAAKNFVVGAYAIANFDSSASIAGTVLGLQLAGLPIDYIDTREETIRSVTLDEVNEEARRLLSVEPSLLVVGPALAASANDNAQGDDAAREESGAARPIPESSPAEAGGLDIEGAAQTPPSDMPVEATGKD